MRCLILLCLGYAIFTLGTLSAANVETEGVPLGNGYLPDDLSLSSVSFVGAHNSSISKEKGWIYAQQAVGLEKQFTQYGVRAFKVPLHWYNPALTATGWVRRLLGLKKKAPYIALCHESHGGDNCFLTRLQRTLMAAPEPALDYLITLRKLLESNPDEVVILILEDYLSSKTKENGMKGDGLSIKEQLGELLEQAGLTEYIYVLGKDYQAQDWPTLGTLRHENRRLIIISNRSEDGMDHVSLYRETAFQYTLNDLLNGNDDEQLRGNSRDRTGRSHFFLMNHFVEYSVSRDSVEGLFLRFVPEAVAHRVNDALDSVDYSELNAYPLVMDRIAHLTELQGRFPNIVLIDFVNKGDDGGVQRAVYETNLLQLSK